jgi:hypothetical protein
MASKLRDIEKAYWWKVYNKKIILKRNIKIIEYFDEMNIKSSLVRDLKLVLLLEF